MTAKPAYRRIATEEAFFTREVSAQYRKLIDSGRYHDPGFNSMWGFYSSSMSDRARFIFDGLHDLGELRISHMDAAGIDHQVIALTAPGVQVFDPATASSLAIDANDQLAEACRRHPARFTGIGRRGAA
jgi:5-carboxyvanillate decarboxylase